MPISVEIAALPPLLLQRTGAVTGGVSEEGLMRTKHQAVLAISLGLPTMYFGAGHVALSEASQRPLTV